MNPFEKKKQRILADKNDIMASIKEADKQYAAAQSSGDKEKAQFLYEDLVKMTSTIDRLESEFSNVESERLSAIQGEIDKPNISEERTPYLGFSDLGFAGGGLNLQEGSAGSTQAYTTPSLEQQEIIQRRGKIGELYNLPPTTGLESERLPAGTIAKLSTLYDPKSKAQLLENEFGAGNVLPIPVGNNTEFVVKVPGGYKTTLDKGAAGIASVVAEVPALATEIGTFLGTTALTKSPGTAVVASSITGAAAGAGIDEALRGFYGLPPDIGNTLTRRGIQGAIGAGTGMVTDVAYPAFRARRMENPFANQYAETLEQSQKRLMAEEEKLAAREGRPVRQITVPTGARLAGELGAEAEGELAGMYAGSNVATTKRQTQEALFGLTEDIKRGFPRTPNDFAGIAARKEAEQNALVDEISRNTGRSRAIIDSAIKRQTTGPLSDTAELGKTLFESLKQAKFAESDARNEAFANVFSQADAAGFKITPEEMISVVSDLKRKANPSSAKDSSGINDVMERLKARRDAAKNLKTLKMRENVFYLSKGKTPPQDLTQEILDTEQLARPITSKDFDNFIVEFNSVRPDNISSGAGADVFGRNIAEGLSAYRRDRYSKLSATLEGGRPGTVADLFDEAAARTESAKQYNVNMLGRVLKEIAGEQSKAPTDIVGEVMKDSYTVGRVVSALKELGQNNPAQAGEADRILGLLQLEYMNKIGIGAGDASRVKIEPYMLQSLFGNQAPAQIRMIKEVNRNLKKLGRFDEAKLTQADLKRMGQPLSEQERKSLAKTITQRIQAEKENAALVRSELYKKAEKGDFKNIDADLLSKFVLNERTTPQQVATVMYQLSKADIQSRNLFKGDLLRNIFDEFAGGEPLAGSGNKLFDESKFLKAYETATPNVNSKFAKKLEIVLGKDLPTRLYDIAKTAKANTIIDSSTPGLTPRLFTSTKGTTFGIPIGSLTSSVRNRYLAAMLGAGTNFTNVKLMLAKNSLPGDVRDFYNQMAKNMFLTREGITALAHQASSDPEFSIELSNMAKQFQEEDKRQKQNLNPASK